MPSPDLVIPPKIWAGEEEPTSTGFFIGVLSRYGFRPGIGHARSGMKTFGPYLLSYRNLSATQWALARPRFSYL